ncbi:Lipoprotein [Litorimonas haliclonae]
MTLRKFLLGTAALALASTSLVLGACAPKDKGESAQISAEAAPLGLSAPDEKVFAQYFNVAERDVSETEANQALKALNLDAEGVMSWESRKGQAGNYVYTDVTSKTDEGSLSIGTAELFGVHMVDDEASFDRANFKDMVLQGEDVNLNIGAMSVARPSPKMAQAIISALQSKDGLDDLETKIDVDETVSFGAISIDDINVSGDEANGNISHIVWGVDEENRVADGKIGKVDFTLTGQNNTTSKLVFEGGSARGLNMNAYQDVSPTGPNLGLGQILGQMNLYAKPYDNIVVGEGSFTNDFVKATFEGFEGKAVEKGGVTTITQVGKPFRFSFLKQPEGPRAAQGYDTLKRLGFDEIVLRSSQTQILDQNNDTIAVQDGLIDMEDGFRLNYTYEAEGLSAMVEKAKLQQANNNSDTDEVTAPTVEETLNALEPVKLRTMKMSLEDKSIVERGLKLASEMSGQSEGNLKKQLKLAIMAATFMGKSDLESEIIGQFGMAATEFIEDGGTLTVSVNPPAPISVKALAESRENNLNPKDIGFSASVTPPEE